MAFMHSTIIGYMFNVHCTYTTLLHIVYNIIIYYTRSDFILKYKYIYTHINVYVNKHIGIIIQLKYFNEISTIKIIFSYEPQGKLKYILKNVMKYNTIYLCIYVCE